MIQFDFPTIECLGPRLRVLAAVSDKLVTFALPPDSVRQIAARLDRVAVLEGRVAALTNDLALATKANALLERQFAERDDAMISLQNRHVTLVIWNIVGGAMACAAIVAIVASWVWS